MTTRGPSRNFAVTSVTPSAFRLESMAAEIASAAPGIVNAARLASGLSGLSGRMAARRFASASAISRVCRLAQMPEQLMQPRPLLA